MLGGDFLPQQAIGADHARARKPEHDPRPIVIDDVQVIADRVESIDVAPRNQGRGGGDRRHFLVEDVVAKPLGAAHFMCFPRDLNFERAAAAEGLGKIAFRRRQAQPAIGAQLRQKVRDRSARDEVVHGVCDSLRGCGLQKRDQATDS